MGEDEMGKSIVDRKDISSRYFRLLVSSNFGILNAPNVLHGLISATPSPVGII